MDRKERNQFKKSFEKIMVPIIGKSKVKVNLMILFKKTNRPIIKGVANRMKKRLDTWYEKLDLNEYSSKGFNYIYAELNQRIDEIRESEVEL